MWDVLRAAATVVGQQCTEAGFPLRLAKNASPAADSPTQERSGVIWKISTMTR
jgi:hypothetical protein